MRKTKPVPVDKLKVAFATVDSSLSADKKNHRNISKAAHLIEEHLGAQLDENLATQMYLALRKIFLLEVLKEMKAVQDDNGFRLALSAHGKPTSAELAYRKRLEKLVTNDSFVTGELLRHYRMCEMSLNKYADGSYNRVEQDEVTDISKIFQRHIKLPEASPLQDVDSRALAHPEDSIMVEFAPGVLIERARRLGVVAPELLPFDKLVSSILSAK